MKEIKDNEEYELFLQEKMKELELKVVNEWGSGKVTLQQQQRPVTQRWGPTAKVIHVRANKTLHDQYVTWLVPVGGKQYLNWQLI